MVTGREGQERNHGWTPMDTDHAQGSDCCCPHPRPSASICGQVLVLQPDDPRMRASGKPSAVQLGGAVGFKAGALGLEGARLIPRRGVDHSPATTGPFGCKARQVRATHAGVGSRAVATPTRRRLTLSGYPWQNTEREQLNDERGVKPLPVSRCLRRCRIGNRHPTDG